MKTRLFVLVGFAIGFAFPTFAQEQKTVSPEVRQQIEALFKKFDDAFNNKDAAALAALYTENAVQVFGWDVVRNGVASGQDEIQQRWASELASGDGTSTEVVQAYPVGDDVCVITRWRPSQRYSIFLIVGGADEWKIRLEYTYLLGG
jgi:ketosteroid isomerase-like protein